MAQHITHVVVESMSGSNTVRSRHYSAAAAESAASRGNMALQRRYPGGCMVSYAALEVWYDDDRRTAPELHSTAAVYAEHVTDYALATR